MANEHVQRIQTADADNARLEIGEGIDLHRENPPLRHRRLAPIAIDHLGRRDLFGRDRPHAGDLPLMHRAQPEWAIGIRELLPRFQRLHDRRSGHVAQSEWIEDGIGVRNIGLRLDQAGIGQRRPADGTHPRGPDNALWLFGAGPLEYRLICGDGHIRGQPAHDDRFSTGIALLEQQAGDFRICRSGIR